MDEDALSRWGQSLADNNGTHLGCHSVCGLGLPLTGDPMVFEQRDLDRYLVELDLFSLLWMFGRSSSFRTWFGYRPPVGGIDGLQPIFFFVTCSLILRSIVPVLIVRGVFKKEPNAFGYRLAGSLKEWWWYG